MQSVEIKAALRRKIQQSEKQVAGLLDRIIESSTPSVVKAYEGCIAELEKEKLAMTETLQSVGRSQRPFSEMFELSLKFLSNP